MHYLVTGGAGFIGSHLCDSLLEAGYQVSVLDNLSSGKRDNLPAGATLIEGDAGDRRLLAALVANADGVFHLAAIASVQQSTQDWSATSLTNQFATIALLEAIAKRKGGPVPFVYASSAAVYGDPDASQLPICEQLMPRPLTPYGADKLGSELHATLARNLFGIPTLGLRFFNVFGERQDPASPYSGVISIFMNRIASGQPVTIFGDGEQTRDFIYVKDVICRLVASMALLERGALPDEAALNICTNAPVSINALAQTIAQLHGAQAQITYAPTRTGDIVHSRGDNTRCEALLNVPVPASLQTGLKQMLAASA